MKAAPPAASALESSAVQPLRQPSGWTDGTIRIVIADDHAIFREGLKRILETQQDFLVVGEAADGAAAVRLVRELSPDMLLLDVSMPRGSGLAVLHELADDDNSPKVLLLTAGVEKQESVRGLQLGARGIVLKDTPTPLLFKSIRKVMSGDYWVGRDMISDLVGALTHVTPPPLSAAGPAGVPHLTRREFDILARVVSGLTNKDIADTLSIAEDTVKRHLTNIFDKTGTSNRLELALYAIHHRLVAPA